MATFYAKRDVAFTSRGLGKTSHLPTTRTFHDEDDAVNQLLTWEKELERKGYRIDRKKDNSITMSYHDSGGSYVAKLEVTRS